jgi:Protein of unknown function (DUF2934)
VAKRRNIDLSKRRSAVDVEIIQRRAYEIYESRGRAEGAALDDWLQAEHELLDEVRRQAVPAEAHRM